MTIPSYDNKAAHVVKTSIQQYDVAMMITCFDLKVHYSPLMHAIELKEENVALVELLLDAGAVVNQETQVNQCLSVCLPVCLSVYALIITSHMHTQNGWCPLTLACNKGYLSTVRLLVQRGANVDVWGEVGT